MKIAISLVVACGDKKNDVCICLEKKRNKCSYK